MALSDILSRRENDSLGEFDENEAKDIALHVRQCGRRYKAMNDKLDTLTKLILFLCLMYALSNVAAMKALIGL